MEFSNSLFSQRMAKETSQILNVEHTVKHPVYGWWKSLTNGKAEFVSYLDDRSMIIVHVKISD